MAMGTPSLLLMLPSLPLLTPYAIIAISPPTVTLLAITPSSNHFAISISQQAHFQSKCHNHWEHCNKTWLSFHQLWILEVKMRLHSDKSFVASSHHESAEIWRWLFASWTTSGCATVNNVSCKLSADSNAPPLFKLHEYNEQIYSSTHTHLSREVESLLTYKKSTV